MRFKEKKQQQQTFAKPTGESTKKNEPKPNNKKQTQSKERKNNIFSVL